ncbi:MAG: hypothetical protein QOE33_687 [Acidobacteriota bacterium]|nr:hypothetical protein [Acidobacteriota bacterium]
MTGNYIASAAHVANALHQLPAPPRDFTGRKEELDELTREIERGGATISGLQGQGGVGKTALALKLAEQLASRFPDAQFYLDLKGTTQPLTPSDAMAHVIRAYHPTAKLPDGEAELSALYNSVLHNQRALLLMDNARAAAQVLPLIPPAGCVLLVTSRQRFTLPGLFARDLDTLPPDDSRKLLLKIADRIGEHADEIARLCDYLPLALRLAASALAERRNLSATDYVRSLTDAQRRLSLIEASLSLSYDLLTPELQKLLRALAVFPDTFDGAAAAAVWKMEQEEAQDALGDLVNHSLLDFDEGTARYSLHDLARLFADNRLTDPERYFTQACHSAYYFDLLIRVEHLFIKNSEAILQGLMIVDAEWTNIEAGQSWAARHAGDSDAMAHLCSDYPRAGVSALVLRLHPRKMISWLEQSLLAAQKLKDQDAESALLNSIGNTYLVFGESRRAIEFFEHCLAIVRQSGDRLVESYGLNNLGIAYNDLGESHRAIELFEQCLNIAREISDQRIESSALGNLGNAYQNLGELQRAIEFQKQRQIMAQKLGDRLGERDALGNLGNCYGLLGEHRRAIEYYKKVLLIDQEIGDRHSEAMALGNLGTAYAALGEMHQAISLLDQQLVIAREVGDQRGEGNAFWNMSLALNTLGNHSQAIVKAEAALKIYEQIEDPNAAMVREALAMWRGQTE